MVAYIAHQSGLARTGTLEGEYRGGRAPDRPPEVPAERDVNIPALALPDRPHHGPRYKIFTKRRPPPAGTEPSQITEPWTFVCAMLLALDPTPFISMLVSSSFADDAATARKSLGENGSASAKTWTGRTIGPMSSAIVQLIPNVFQS